MGNRQFRDQKEARQLSNELAKNLEVLDKANEALDA
jgi:hypothetical protein